jgi:hypothetical protein
LTSCAQNELLILCTSSHVSSNLEHKSKMFVTNFLKQFRMLINQMFEDKYDCVTQQD